MGMDSRARLEAIMECPLCSHNQLPADDSGIVMAWYECVRCGHHWSARLRAGRPAPVQPFDIPDLHARSG